MGGREGRHTVWAMHVGRARVASSVVGRGMAILAVGKGRQALNIMQADVQSKKVRQGWHARWATLAVKKGKAGTQVAKQDKAHTY